MKDKLTAFLAAVCAITFAAMAYVMLIPSDAQAQTIDAPPACDPWKTGKGIAIGQVGNVYAATWWCQVNGAWLEQRAAVVLPDGTDAKQRAIEAINASDMALLVKNRDVPLSDPRFGPVFAAMAKTTAANKPK